MPSSPLSRRDHVHRPQLDRRSVSTRDARAHRSADQAVRHHEPPSRTHAIRDRRLPAALRSRHELAHRHGLRPRPPAAAPRLTIEQNRQSTPHQSKEPPMSPYLYRRLMHEKLARLRQHPDAASSHTHGSHRGCGCSRSTRTLQYDRTTRGREEPCREPPPTYRQLDQRTVDGLAVTLEWNPTTDALH